MPLQFGIYYVVSFERTDFCLEKRERKLNRAVHIKLFSVNMRAFSNTPTQFFIKL
jgi:hypothetical protein